MPYCFSRSSVKFQGHTALKIVEFDPNWAFPDCNSSLNSPMAMKCCTKLETAKERCSIVFQGHPSNFKVTRYKTSPILTQIGRFWTIGRSQLSNPSDLPCLGSSIKYQGHTGWKIDDLNPVWVRLLGRSQLSNTSDLPCFVFFCFFFAFFFSKVRVGAKEGGSHYWEMAVAITCGYGGYLLPLLAAHSSLFFRNFYPLSDRKKLFSCSVAKFGNFQISQ